MKYIACSSSNEYAQHAGVMITSIIENHINDDLSFIILTLGIDDTNYKKIMSISNHYNKKIEIINVDKTVFKDCPDLGHWGLYVYSKLFIGDFIDKTIDKILFLDVDMIINKPFYELFELNIEEYAFAATEDMPNCVRHKKRLNIDSESLYANTGFMIINLNYWRKNKIKEKCFDYIKQNRNLIEVAEQDVLNAVCNNKILCLPIKYNMQSPYYFVTPQIFDKYKTDLEIYKKDPVVIHFSEFVKPWHKECFHPLRYKYQGFLKKTPWADSKPSIYAKRPFLYLLKTRCQYIINSFPIKIFKNHYIQKI
ncbi:MAG: glycosyltransferase family 8 protein [Bacteroidales bacterium]|nr:glycosyltransferase family 8 protein [Bacteroidales bacterium]